MVDRGARAHAHEFAGHQVAEQVDFDAGLTTPTRISVSGSTILLLSGPNLNLLGEREPEIYGATTLADIVKMVTEACAAYGHEVKAFQSNHEGALVDFLQEQRKEAKGIIFNPGAFTHSSIALHDCLKAVPAPIVEVAVLFAGIFVTIVPVLAMLKAGELDAAAEALQFQPRFGAGVAVLFRDVTERRALFDRAALAAERAQLAMDAAQLGIWQWICEATPPPWQEKFRKLAVEGRHWMITPFRELTLIHAVQQPLAAPVLQGASAGRNLEETSYTLRGLLQVHGKTT